MAMAVAAEATKRRLQTRLAAQEAAETSAQETALERTALHEQPGMLVEALKVVALAAKAADGLLEARMARWRMTRRMAAQTAVTERRWRAARLVVLGIPGMMRRAFRPGMEAGIPVVAARGAAGRSLPARMPSVSVINW